MSILWEGRTVDKWLQKVLACVCVCVCLCKEGEREREGVFIKSHSGVNGKKNKEYFFVCTFLLLTVGCEAGSGQLCLFSPFFSLGYLEMLCVRGYDRDGNGYAEFSPFLTP